MNSHFNQPPPIQKSYIRKVMKGLKNIKIALAKVTDNPSDREAVMEVRGIARAISELAMIYGYNGVESIAGKISTSFKYSKIKSDPDFLYKIKIAVKGIQRVVEMEGGLENKLTVKKVAGGGGEVFKQISGFDELGEAQRRMVELQSDANLLFDIREGDFLGNISVVPVTNKIKPVSETTQKMNIHS